VGMSAAVSCTAVIHSKSSSVDTVMVSDAIMLLVDSRPRKHICKRKPQQAQHACTQDEYAHGTGQGGC
jgi:hypothetical protein